jgi:hypothetical protein
MVDPFTGKNCAMIYANAICRQNAYDFIEDQRAEFNAKKKAAKRKKKVAHRRKDKT